MRLSVLPFLALSLPALGASASTSLPAKETLYYNVEWRLIAAGKARLDWTSLGSSAPRWRVHMHLESVGLVSKLFKVDDDYSADLDDSLSVESLQAAVREGSRQRDTSATFDYRGGKATYLEHDRLRNAVAVSQESEIPHGVHDVVGGLYYLRTLNLEPGQSASVPVSDGKKTVMARIEAQQREEIKTPAGTFKTTRYEIYLFNNVLYRRSAHLYAWIADDARSLPVQIRVRMQFTTGTISLELAKYE